jgi:imidazole glycerol phosphate synthase subunit HisF
MKKHLIGLLGVSVGLSAVVLPVVSLAAGVNLYNGGFGQVAGNAQNFGVAVCNGGTSAVTQSVPVSITVGSQTVSVSSAASIAAGKCEYTYLPYGQLGMQAAGTYSVTVTIDPNRSLISNINNQSTYNVTVAGNTTAQAGNSAPETANANAQSGNFFAMLFNWIASWFK